MYLTSNWTIVLYSSW